jgi:clan AA aspartic protease
VPLRIRAPGGPDYDLDAIIDTAFSGSLTLPPALISSLNLPFRARVSVQLGDGTIGQFDSYDVEIEWDGAWIPLTATEIDTAPLLGIGLLRRMELFIEFIPGGVVDITRIP